jgi:hypothetical protein
MPLAVFRAAGPRILRIGCRKHMSRKHLYAWQPLHPSRNSASSFSPEIPENAVDHALPTSYAPSTMAHLRVPNGVSIRHHNPETRRARIY